MEVTALRGGQAETCSTSPIVFSPSVASAMDAIPTSAKTKRRPKAYLTIETPVVACPFRVKLRNIHHEQMSSALSPTTDVSLAYPKTSRASNFMEYRSEVTRVDLARY